MSIANGIDVSNLFERIAEAQRQMLAEAAKAKAASAVCIFPASKEALLARAVAFTEASRTLDKLCFVADVDGCVPSLEQFPRDWQIISREEREADDLRRAMVRG